MKKQIKNKKQFTLIELIIVIVVIGILAAMAMPKFIGVQRNAHVAAMEQDLDVIEKAVMQYVMATDDGSYPFVDINEDTKINEEDLYFKTGTIPQTLTDTLLKANGDDGSKIYKLDMDKLKPYIDKLKYPDTEYVYSPNSDTAIDPVGKPDGDNNIHHIIGSGNTSGSNENNSILLTSLVKNKNVSSAYHSVLYIGNDGEVYGAGELFDNYEEITTFTKMTTNANAKKVIATYNNWAYINDKGEVFTRGVNYDKQLGRNYVGSFSSDFGLAPLPKGVKAVDIDLTQYTAVVLGDDGYLYVCGYNIYFKDSPLLTNDNFIKLDLPNGEKVKAFDTADGCLSIVDVKGNVHVIGNNGTRTYLGLESKEWGTYSNFENKIVDVSVGDDHTIVIDEKGNIYGAGKNQSGELGIGDKNERNSFVKIPLPDGVIPKSIECGYNSTLILTTDNRLYGFGRNEYGVFGEEMKDWNLNVRTSPTEIKYEDTPQIEMLYSINSSTCTTFVYGLRDGSLYGIGSNSYGSFGKGDNLAIFIKPELLNLPKSLKIK